jgi:hypothetical protein
MYHGCIIKVGVDTIFISKKQTNKKIFLLDKITLMFPYPKRTRTNFASMRPYAWSSNKCSDAVCIEI